jgi:hypothetical protein
MDEEFGDPFGEALCAALRRSGLPVDIIDWAYNAKILSQFACSGPLQDAAAEVGSVPVLQWRMKEGFLSRITSMTAAAHGQLADVQYLASVGHTKCEEVFPAYAAGAGSVQLLQWLHAQHGRAPWYGGSTGDWSKAGVTAVLADAFCTHEQQPHRCSCTSHLRVVQWLRAHGADWPQQLWQKRPLGSSTVYGESTDGASRDLHQGPGNAVLGYH